MDFNAFTDEFCKLAGRPVSKEEAERSLRKLRSMEEDRDLAAVGRSAATGAALMPVAGLATRMVAGTQRFMKPERSFNLRKPFSTLKSMDWSGLTRGLASDATMGAIGGGVLPLARESVERNAQKAKLEDYIQQQEGVKPRGRAARFHKEVQKMTGLG